MIQPSISLTVMKTLTEFIGVGGGKGWRVLSCQKTLENAILSRNRVKKFLSF